MSPTATAARRTRAGIAPERANRLAATFAAGAARPAPPMDDDAVAEAVLAEAALVETSLAETSLVETATGLIPDPTSSVAVLLHAVPEVALPTARTEPEQATLSTPGGTPAAEVLEDAVGAGGASTSPTVPASPIAAPTAAVDAGARPARAARTAPAKATPAVPCTVRIKQTVELPEDVYEQVQDFARGHRTSFQVLVRALVDDLLTGEDNRHRARLAALIEVAEQEKRARKRRSG